MKKILPDIKKSIKKHQLIEKAIITKLTPHINLFSLPLVLNNKKNNNTHLQVLKENIDFYPSFIFHYNHWVHKKNIGDQSFNLLS